MSAQIQIFAWAISLQIILLTENIQPENAKLDILVFYAMNVKIVLAKFQIPFVLIAKEASILQQ